MAATALGRLPVELREFQNLAISFEPSRISRAKKLIREFVARFNREIEDRPGTEIFHLDVCFYRVSEPEGKS